MGTADKVMINSGHIMKELNIEFDTIREAYAHPDIKEIVLRSFTDQVEQFQEGKFFMGDQHAKHDIPDAILNHPKVLFEPSFYVERGVIAKAFAEVGEVRLPFPKITVLKSVLGF